MKKIFSILSLVFILTSCEKKEEFNCDNQNLIRIVEEKTGPLENIITVNKNDELKTCDCEAFAPNLVYKTGYSRMSSSGIAATRIYEKAKGTTIKYTAQLKDDGQIVWQGQTK